MKLSTGDERWRASTALWPISGMTVNRDILLMLGAQNEFERTEARRRLSSCFSERSMRARRPPFARSATMRARRSRSRRTSRRSGRTGW